MRACVHVGRGWVGTLSVFMERGVCVQGGVHAFCVCSSKGACICTRRCVCMSTGRCACVAHVC